MGRTFCSSDWHGAGELANKILGFLKPDDTLYFIGDAVDRGADGFEIFQKLISDPRVKFIRGNHEQMMADSIIYAWEDVHNLNCDCSDKYEDWYYNGGEATAKDLLNLTKDEIYDIQSKIYHMPTELIYNSPKGHTIIMEHAGYTPFDLPHRTHDPLWDRNHFHDIWRGGESQVYLVHGHTPVQYLKFRYGYYGDSPLTQEEWKYKREWVKNLPCTFKPTIIRYCEGHKFDIDMCTAASDRIALLDLDTFEEIYFDKENI